jgi:uncharacterized protein YbjT (DUF2867 family)
MRAIIIGASGLVGSNLIEKLLSDPSIDTVISFARKSQSRTHPKLSEVIAPTLDDLEKYSDRLQGDLYFCCIGSTIKKAKTEENFKKVDLDAVIKFAEMAKKNHAKSFVVVSSMGADRRSYFFYNRVKGEMENQLTSLGLFSVVIFRPSLLIGIREEKRFAESIGIRIFHALDYILPSSLSRKMGTDVEHLAQRMVEVAKQKKPGVQIILASEIQ